MVGSLLRSKLVDDTSPIVYGVADNLAVYSDDGGELLGVEHARWAWRRWRWRRRLPADVRRAAARRMIRT